MSIAIIISASVMAMISAFVLFKLAERNDRDNDKFSKQINVGFQLLMFFMLFASLFLVGKAGFDARDDCDFLLINTSSYVNVSNYTNTLNEYDYVCETNDNMTASWTYRLPLWLFRIGGFILFLYALNWMIKQIKLLTGDKRDQDD